MKKHLCLWAFLLHQVVSIACRGATPAPAPFAKQPLTLSHAEVVATIQHMQALAKQAEADTDAAKAAEQAEHQAHVAAQSDADASKVEAAKLGEAVAQAQAQRDAEKARANREKARGDALSKEVHALFLKLVLLFVAAWVSIYFAGATMENAARQVVSAIGSFLLSGVRWVRLALKAAFPTFLFWL